jgi:hypothetical protein
MLFMSKSGHMSVISRVFGFISLVLFGPASAQAQGEPQIGAKGISPPVCTFTSTFRATSTQNMSLSGAGSAGARITVTELIDATAATLKPATVDLAVNAICNMPHQLTLTSTRGALVPEMPPIEADGAFLKTIHYRATANWGTDNLSLIANGSSAPHSASRDIPVPRVGDLTVQVRVDGTDNEMTTPVLSAIYSDILTITINARL